MPDTYHVITDPTLIVGFFGIVSSVIIVVFAYRRYWNSPYRQ